jgi:hypothetical protein
MTLLSRRDFIARIGAIAACATIPTLVEAQTSENYLFPAGIQASPATAKVDRRSGR